MAKRLNHFDVFPPLSIAVIPPFPLPDDLRSAFNAAVYRADKAGLGPAGAFQQVGRRRMARRFADDFRERLELLGRERALIYKTLVLTGLRKGELASLTVVQLHVDGAVPLLSLDAGDEKNRQGNDVPLRDDLAADLRGWLGDKLSRMRAEAAATGAPVPTRLPPATPLFDVPDKLCKILNRDLKFAGIPKRDERGRTLDVHALRHTFGTLLSKGGVAPRTAQAAMPP